MANFDFGSPITKDTLIKASWCCEDDGSNPELSYKGDFFRITVNGVTYVPNSLDEALAAAYVTPPSPGNLGASGVSSITLHRESDGEEVSISYKDISNIELTDKGWDIASMNSSGYASKQLFWGLRATNISGKLPEDIPCDTAFSHLWQSSDLAYSQIGSTDITGLIFKGEIARKYLISMFLDYPYGASHNLAYSNNSTNQNTGIYGNPIMEISVADATNGLKDGLNSSYAGDIEKVLFSIFKYGSTKNSTILAMMKNSIAYKTGVGFAGTYANEWLDYCPAVSEYQDIGATFSTLYIRNTHLA